MANYPPCPERLPEQLRKQYDILAPVLFSMGTLRSVDADALGRYLMLEWEYSATVKRVVDAINNGDVGEVERWASVQDKLHKQIMTLADRFGLTPSARAQRGLLLPNDA